MAGRKPVAFDCEHQRAMMTRKQAGFTIVELMVTMVIFVFVIAAASNMFTGILNSFKQQSKIAETNIEGLVGLQMLRTDMEQAGYGLPSDLDGITYTEATSAPASAYNDTNGTTFFNPPRAFAASNNNGFNASDVLVIKATSAATNAAAYKWGYISNTMVGTTNTNVMQVWTNATGAAVADENFANGDRVIVLKPEGGADKQVLINSGGIFYTQYNSSLGSFDDTFEPPANSYQTYLIYGISSDTVPVRPFNRADYYISSSSVPSHCAPNTGVLIKSVINHNSGGTRGGGLPLLDCVADMQLVYAMDTDKDGILNSFSSTPPATADLVRTQLKEIRVYILGHEGQKDLFYAYPTASITLTDLDAGTLKTFDLSTVIGPAYANYRWKVYTLVIKPFNLR